MPADFTFGSSPTSSMTAFGGSTEGDIFKQFYPKYLSNPDALSGTQATTTPSTAVNAAANAVAQATAYGNAQAGGGASVPKSAAEEYGWTFKSQPLSPGSINTGKSIASMDYSPEAMRMLQASGISTDMGQRRLAQQAIEAYNQSLGEYLATPEIAPQATAYREQYGSNPELYKQAQQWMAGQSSALGDRWNPTLPSFGLSLDETYRNRLLAPYLQA